MRKKKILIFSMGVILGIFIGFILLKYSIEYNYLNNKMLDDFAGIYQELN